MSELMSVFNSQWVLRLKTHMIHPYTFFQIHSVSISLQESEGLQEITKDKEKKNILLSVSEQFEFSFWEFSV